MEDSDASSSDKEELEIALYSQIHFEHPGDELSELCHIDKIRDSNKITVCDLPQPQPDEKDFIKLSSSLTSEDSDSGEDTDSSEDNDNGEEQILPPIQPNVSHTIAKTNKSLLNVQDGLSGNLSQQIDTAEKQKTNKKNFIRFTKDPSPKKKSYSTKLQISVKPREPPVRLRRKQFVNVAYKVHSDTNTDTSSSEEDKSDSETTVKSFANVQATRSVIKPTEPELKATTSVVVETDGSTSVEEIEPEIKANTSVVVVDSDGSASVEEMEQKPTPHIKTEDLINYPKTIKEEEAQCIVSNSSEEESSSSENSEADIDVTTLKTDPTLEFNLTENVNLLKQEQLDAGKDITELWKINEEDTYKITSAISRYFCPKKIQCRNCKELGHLSRDCPLPLKQRCIFCAKEGHINRNCPESVCFKCNCPGHRAKDCTNPRQNNFRTTCNRCLLPGHIEKHCPDNWRQFHITTKPGLVKTTVKSEPSDSVNYCYNCGEHGHLGFECVESRMNTFVPPSYPFIAKYCDTGHFGRELFATMGMSDLFKGKRTHEKHGKHKDGGKKGKKHKEQKDETDYSNKQRSKKRKSNENSGNNKRDSLMQHTSHPEMSTASYSLRTNFDERMYFPKYSDDENSYGQDFEKHQVSRNEWWKDSASSSKKSQSSSRNRNPGHRRSSHGHKRARDEDEILQHEWKKPRNLDKIHVTVNNTRNDQEFGRRGRMRHSHSAPNLGTNEPPRSYQHHRGHGYEYGRSHGPDMNRRQAYYHQREQGHQRNVSGFQSKSAEFKNMSRKIKRVRNR